MLNMNEESCPVVSITAHYIAVKNQLREKFQNWQSDSGDNQDLIPAKEAIDNECKKIEAKILENNSIASAVEIMESLRKLLPANIFITDALKDEKKSEEFKELYSDVGRCQIDAMYKMRDKLNEQEINTTAFSKALDEVKNRMSAKFQTEISDLSFKQVWANLVSEITKIQSNLEGTSELEDFYLFYAWVYAFETKLTIAHRRFKDLDNK